MSSIVTIVSKISQAPRRRGDVIIDINADFHGRRPTGDPRLDLALAARR